MKQIRNTKLLQIAFISIIIARCINLFKELCFDNDTFFLIANGEYIINNKALPTINPWNIVDNLGIIIQQWICSVSNYLAFKAFNFNGILIITIINSIIFTLIFIKYIKEFNNSKVNVCIIAAPFLAFMLWRWGSARPTLVTSYIMLIHQIVSKRYFSKERHDIKEIIVFNIKMMIISILQVNYHSSMWILTVILLLPYMAPSINDLIKLRVNVRKIIEYTLTIMLIVLSSMLNPNGLNGPLYLLKSYGSANSLGIVELRAASIDNLACIPVVLVIVLFVLTIYIGKIHKQVLYLTLGTLYLAIDSERSIWFIIFAYVQLASIVLNDVKISERINYYTDNIADYLNSKIYVKVISVVSAFLGVVCVVITCINAEVIIDDSKLYNLDAIDYLNETVENKEDVKLFTNFNNGGGYVLNGYKVYIDARPELYASEITGGYNILQEYIDLGTDKLSFEEFFDKYDFSHIVVVKESLTDLYMKYNHDGYIPVIYNDNYTLYEREDFNK